MSNLRDRMPDGLFDELMYEVPESTVFDMPLATMTSDELAVVALLIGKKRQGDMVQFHAAMELAESAYKRSRRSFWLMVSAFLCAAGAALYYAALFYFP